MIITISPSSLDSLQECPTKYNFSTLKRLRLIEEDTSRLDRGTLYHKLLAMHYQLIINGINDESQKLEYPQVIAAVREFARGLGREDLFPLDMIEECIESYQDYAVYYANDGWTPIAVEAPFSKTFYEEEDLTIIMEGKIDLIARLEDMTFARMQLDSKRAMILHAVYIEIRLVTMILLSKSGVRMLFMM